MDEPKKCASCDMEVSSPSVYEEGEIYCCPGCAQGGPCVCSYVYDPATRPRDGRYDLRTWQLYGSNN